jgi:glutathione S-transferase
MFRLHGFPISNYYNKVKLALIEKAVPYEEVLNMASKDDGTLALSPLGKVPFAEVDGGCLAESHVLMEYIEERWPTPPLLPTDPLARGKVRELCAFLELHLELVARRLYPQSFFGKTVSDQIREDVRKELTRNIQAFSRLARFSPWLAGDAFTMADCAGLVHLPLISMATKAIYGEDMLAALPVREYLARLSERASVQQVNADRKSFQQAQVKT